MKLPSLLGKLPKHKEFNYSPRIYNPEKNDFEFRSRLAEIKREEAEEEKISFREERLKYNARVNRTRLIIGSCLLAIILTYLFI